MASALCSSAWAQTSIQKLAGFVNEKGEFEAKPVEKLENGHQYVLVNSTDANEAYGHELSDGKLKESTMGLSDELDKNDDVQKYVWTVSVTEAPTGYYSYNFTNVKTGKLLRLNGDRTALEKNPAVDAKKAYKDFVFDKASATTFTGNEYSKENGYLYSYSKETPKGFTWTGDASSVPECSEATAPVIYEVKSEWLTDSEELNALYNTSGFSFVSKYIKDQSGEPAGNLFNEKIVVARYLSQPIKIDATNYPGYSGDTDDLQIPAGMYFFTAGTPEVGNVDYNKWLNATVLVVSSTETMEGTNTGRANGDGFVLTEKKISDLNVYVGAKDAWKTQGDEISINNACFRVQKSYVQAYPYELNVDHFRFREQGNKAAHKEAKIKFETLQHNDNFYLATTSATADQFIFKMGVSGTKKVLSC